MFTPIKYYTHSLLTLIRGDLEAFDKEHPGITYDVKVALDYTEQADMEHSNVEDISLIIAVIPIEE